MQMPVLSLVLVVASYAQHLNLGKTRGYDRMTAINAAVVNSASSKASEVRSPLINQDSLCLRIYRRLPTLRSSYSQSKNAINFSFTFSLLYSAVFFSNHSDFLRISGVRRDMARYARLVTSCLAFVMLVEYAQSQPCNISSGGETGKGTPDNLMEKKTIDVSQHKMATCNDNSSAIYYIRRAKASAKWVIFLEGGELCATPEACERRAEEASWQTSSRAPVYCNTMAGKTILDPRPERNRALFDWNHVYIPYCTSDLHLGRTITPPFSPRSQFVFRGAFVIEAILNDLQASHGLADMANSTVLFSGETKTEI